MGASSTLESAPPADAASAVRTPVLDPSLVPRRTVGTRPVGDRAPAPRAGIAYGH